MKKLIVVLFIVSGISQINAQTKEELKALQKEKNDSISVLKGKADAIQSEIDALPGAYQDSTIGILKKAPILL